MRYLYFPPVVAALSLALAVPGRLSAQAADSSKATASANTVTCKDGTTSPKAQGACSHHGGMVRLVSCKDGTMSKKGKGACSHHGGVVTKHASAAKTSSNQTKPGVTNTQTGQSTMGDTLKRGDSTSSSPNR